MASKEYITHVNLILHFETPLLIDSVCSKIKSFGNAVADKKKCTVRFDFLINSENSANTIGLFKVLLTNNRKAVMKYLDFAANKEKAVCMEALNLDDLSKSDQIELTNMSIMAVQNPNLFLNVFEFHSCDDVSIKSEKVVKII